ncbi:MAG: hypothetical protein R6X27_05790 [Candidatus Desulfacyla sp.]
MRQAPCTIAWSGELEREDVEKSVRDYYDERGWKGGWVEGV